jgi:predicted phage terminase large subunit-like protein
MAKRRSAEDDLLLQELTLREALAWREEKEACEQSLATFLRTAWRHFDPAPYIGNWHIDAICEHLQAVSNGQLKRLLINIPPRHSKTNIVSIAWPVWTWCLPPDPAYPLHGPGVKFLCASYGSQKAEQDGVTARRLLASAWLQDKWGDRIRVCLPPDELVHTEAGLIPIGRIVEERLPLRVWSWCEQTQQVELRPITQWHRNPAAEIVRLILDNGTVVRCTGDHRIRTARGDWSAANLIPLGTDLLAIRTGQSSRRLPERFAGSDRPDLPFVDVVAGSQRGGRFGAHVDRSRDLSVDCRPLAPALLHHVAHVLRARAVDEVVLAAIHRITVKVADLFTGRRLAYEGLGHQPMDFDAHSLAAAPQVQMRIAVAVRRRLHDLLRDNLPNLTERHRPEHHPRKRFDASVVGDHVAREIHQTDPELARIVDIAHDGFAPQTYCLTVADNHNFIAGGDAGIIVANCRDRDNQNQFDTEAGGSRINTGIPESLGKGGMIRILDDPQKGNEVESDLVRDGIIRAYNEIWRTRSNDPAYGAEVVIMQRLHSMDVAGHILEENDPGLCHLMLPEEYDPTRHCVTVLGFSDPRTVDGELLWPERFDAEWVKKQKVLIGPHAWHGQFQQSPSIRGGGVIPREWWKVWPPEGQEETWSRAFDVNGRTVRRMVYPDLEFILVSADTAYTEKEENDFSACTVWGVFADEAGNPKAILIEAWRDRLQLRGLVDKLLDTARRQKADMVLIEGKASGLSVAQEIRRLMRGEEFSLVTGIVKGDKIARLHAVSPIFSAGLIYAPNRRWADMVIEEVASVPRSKHDDLADATSAGVKRMRDLGLLQHPAEVEAERLEAMTWHGRETTVREEYGV